MTDQKLNLTQGISWNKMWLKAITDSYLSLHWPVSKPICWDFQTSSCDSAAFKNCSEEQVVS